MTEDKIPFPNIELTDDEWRNTRANPQVPLIYTHCRHCISSVPDGESPESWSRLTAFINLETGVLTVGCMRCELPIVSAIVNPALVAHLNKGCACEHCRERGKDG